VCRFNGKPVATESDIPFKEKLLGLMGIGVAPNGDVWIADGSDDQLLFFPGGQIKDGRIVKMAGLKSLRGASRPNRQRLGRKLKARPNSGVQFRPEVGVQDLLDKDANTRSNVSRAGKMKVCRVLFSFTAASVRKRKSRMRRIYYHGD